MSELHEHREEVRACDRAVGRRQVPRIAQRCAAVERRVRTWATHTEMLANEVCRRVSTNLTTQQWNDYVSDSASVPYQATCPERTTGSGPR